MIGPERIRSPPAFRRSTAAEQDSVPASLLPEQDSVPASLPPEQPQDSVPASLSPEQPPAAPTLADDEGGAGGHGAFPVALARPAAPAALFSFAFRAGFAGGAAAAAAAATAVRAPPPVAADAAAAADVGGAGAAAAAQDGRVNEAPLWSSTLRLLSHVLRLKSLEKRGETKKNRKRHPRPLFSQKNPAGSERKPCAGVAARGAAAGTGRARVHKQGLRCIKRAQTSRRGINT